MEMGRGERSMWLYISVQKGDHIDFSEVFDRPLSLEFSDSPDLFWECKALTNNELRGQYESIIAQKVFSRTALIDIMFLRKMLETHPGWVDYSLAAHVRPYNPEEEIKLRKILSL